MKKRVKFQIAILAIFASTAAYADESCLTNVGDKTPVDVFQCFEAKLNSQQKRITELEKENKRLRQKTDAFAVSSNSNVGIGTTSPSAKLDVKGDIFINSETGTEEDPSLIINAENSAHSMTSQKVFEVKGADGDSAHLEMFESGVPAIKPWKRNCRD
ncbi:hypothetical protein [Candidatus Parabeggiatoa sp. HSG14]|uniref:hypothetical protein n=1 Tax=Candidatus Parabeggiatoa sp. HSG14 TaxID=3055593 RepID=UPI0025A7896E|nr:hypothetical protein [Thiotrichales bacterium HSG14]